MVTGTQTAEREIMGIPSRRHARNIAARMTTRAAASFAGVEPPRHHKQAGFISGELVAEFFRAMFVMLVGDQMARLFGFCFACMRGVAVIASVSHFFAHLFH
jgi:hypothetical protein